MDALTLLHSRNSAPRLTTPAPSAEVLERFFGAALRAPDHARLRPWRFLTVTGNARHQLGDLFAKAALQRNPSASDAELDKCRQQPLRAPMLIIVIAPIQEHPKVPRDEQLLSAGCAAHGILLAAHAEGFAGVWRTGVNATDPVVKAGLGLAANEELVAYLYIGTIDGNYKALPELSTQDFVSDWKG